MELTEALQTLRERRDWLTQCIKAKTTVGWDIQWDTRERDALSCVLEQLTEHTTIRNTNDRPAKEAVIVLDHIGQMVPLQF